MSAVDQPGLASLSPISPDTVPPAMALRPPSQGLTPLLCQVKS